MPSKVLVLGGAGFLGSHVADALSEAGYDVRVFDVRHSPYLRADQEMITGDILEDEDLVKAADGCAAIYNFAGLADIPDAADRPVDTVQLNVLGTVKALEAAREAGVDRYVFASSVYVYSESGSFYRASKQAAERYIETYHERYGLDYTILRYGSLYGRRADERNAIHRMINEALATGQIRFSGPREAIREYIHARDAARLSVDILTPEFANRHLVLTGAESLPVEQVMQMLAEILPEDVELVFESDNGAASRYVFTPYAYSPRIGHKLVATDFVDLGQGLMDCIAEIHERTGDPATDGRGMGVASWY